MHTSPLQILHSVRRSALLLPHVAPGGCRGRPPGGPAVSDWAYGAADPADAGASSGDGVTQSSLTKSLRELERDGFLHREVYQEIPPRVEYTLTDMGQSFAPILHSMLAACRICFPAY